MNPIRRKIAGAALGGTLMLGGAAGAFALTGTAGAQDTTTPTTVVTQTSPAQVAPSQGPSGQAAPPSGTAPDPSKGGHVANGVTETLLTGDAATKATAAALEAVPGATLERVENDAEGATYEAHVTKTDGSRATVKLDADFKVTSVETGGR